MSLKEGDICKPLNLSSLHFGRDRLISYFCWDIFSYHSIDIHILPSSSVGWTLFLSMSHAFGKDSSLALTNIYSNKYAGQAKKKRREEGRRAKLFSHGYVHLSSASVPY